jgi:hypothetical protein
VAHASTSEVSDGPSHDSAPRLDAPNASGFSTADSQGLRASVASAPAAELVVPRGAVLPAAFLDPAEKASPAQVGALDRLADDFVREVTTVDATASSSVVPPVEKRIVQRTQPSRWDAATQQANERYRQLFGVEAYKAWTAAAAKDALTEK